MTDNFGRPYEMVRGLCPRDMIRGAVDARQAHRGKRGQNRSSLTDASNPPRQSSGGRGVEDAAPYGGCETYSAAYDVTGVVPSRLTNGARAVPAGYVSLGGGRHRVRRGKRGCHWPRRPSAPTLPRRSRNRGASRTPPLTGDSETNVSAWNVTDAVKLYLTAPLKRTHTHPP